MSQQIMRKEALGAARLAGEGKMLKRDCVAAYFAVVFISTSLIFVKGLPIRGPDLNTCEPFFSPSGDAVDCCFVDTSRPIKEFKFNLDLPMRVRRPAHKLDDEFIRNYERAVELMKALPPEDPRSFSAQANLHCAYSGDTYKQFNSSAKLDVHHSWFVMPFHRWFTYFHERILASLIGDDTFGIPYWAWDVQNEDNPPANIIPPIYTNKNSSLYHENRSKLHQPPYRPYLQYALTFNELTNPDILLQENYYSMWASMIGHARTAEAFYGATFSQGDTANYWNGGEFEIGPHGSIHLWIGDEDNFLQDMGWSASAARDPIFFPHHSNVDRLWLMWKSFGGLDYDDPDWLDAEFVLYDENADRVRVNIKDSLNFDNFRITYDEVEADWLNYTPKSIRDIDPKYAKSSSILRRFWQQAVTWGTHDNYVAMALGSFLQQERSELRVSLGGKQRATVTSRVSRPNVVNSMEDSSVSDMIYDEVLVITGVVEKPFDAMVLVNMFLELPEADENTPLRCVEFLGGVRVDADGLALGTVPIITREFRRIIGIRETLRILGITRQKSVTVTFVLASHSKYDADISVRVTDLKVERRRVR